MGQAPSFGENSPIGERIGRSFRFRTPKLVARMPAAVGLFCGPENGGESLVRSRLERAKGFEPSTPTLARLHSVADHSERGYFPIPSAVTSPAHSVVQHFCTEAPYHTARPAGCRSAPPLKPGIEQGIKVIT